MTIVDQEFEPAPIGSRVIAVTIASAVGVLGLLAADLVTVLPHLRPGMPLTKRILAPVGPWVAAVIASGLFAYQKANQKIGIRENVLWVGKKSYKLAGLTEAVQDRLVLKSAHKCWGNGGLGGISGRYKSKRLGKFDAQLTDTEKAVVLRWPDRVLAVSPNDPEFFILMARKAAGLK